MLKLRGHHLICLHFFSGEGYDDSFVENLKNVLKRAEDEEIEVCHGADDVCRRCPHLKDYKCQYDEHADKEVREMDETALSLLKVNPDIRVRWQEVKKKIPEIFSEWFENYCMECDWKQVCEKNHFYYELKRR
ncbi:MAG: DUF1284 domain-containing protein [Nitrospirota bacterium]